MNTELRKLEEILEKIYQITKESQKYWLGEVGEYHRECMEEWYKESSRLLSKIRKETDHVG